jgi:thioredoxin 1
MKKFIYFTASWCQPCKTYAPIISQVNATVSKVDIEENRELAMQYNVRAVPTTILLKDGVEVWRHSGVLPLSILQQTYDNN